ncbi:hypothetical protein GBA52_024780 [Prunus armeniaca]|nr:hypothetical protein GBA52_024780 [Prunus armeniaca]
MVRKSRHRDEYLVFSVIWRKENWAISGEFVEGAKAISDQGFHGEGDFRGCLEGGDDFWWWSRQWWRFLASLYSGDNMGANEEGAKSEGIVEGLIEEGRVGAEKQLVSSEGEVYREMQRNYVMLEAVANQVLDIPHTL